MPLPAWLTKTVAIVIGTAVAALLLAGLFAWHEWQASRTADVKTKLATGQATAAIQSGSDAVQTIGNAMTNETDIHATVKDGTDEINQAPAGNSNDAADRATCRLRSYRHTSKCVALLGPVAR